MKGFEEEVLEPGWYPSDAGQIPGIPVLDRDHPLKRPESRPACPWKEPLHYDNQVIHC